MSDKTRDKAEGTTKRRRGRKRSDHVADQIKQWIVEEEVLPGARLPQERELMARFEVSKGTVREALKSLEVQGLVQVRTGPGGGAAVTVVSYARAMELLGNYFYSQDITLKDIYGIRKVIEPELASAVAGRLDTEHLQRLEHSIGLCACEPLGRAAERMQRIAELDFHDVLADACPNPILGFYCRFINSLLKNLAVCHRIYDHPHKDLTHKGQVYHRALVDALRAGDGAEARRVMLEHMEEAERLMLASEARLERRFLLPEDITAG